MSKTVKITKSQISQLVNEEVKKFKRVKELEAKKGEIMAQLNEMYETEELEEIFGLGNKIGQVMGTKWNQQQAEQAYAQTYAKQAPAYAQKLGIDVNTLKAALVKFMMDNGGAAILGGQGQNAQWDAASNSFKRLSSKTGGQGAFSLGTNGE